MTSQLIDIHTHRHGPNLAGDAPGHWLAVLSVDLAGPPDAGHVRGGGSIEQGVISSSGRQADDPAKRESDLRLAPISIASDGPLSCGLHPWSLEAARFASDFDALRAFAEREPRCLAIGECGFDRAVATSWELQVQAFQAQLALAEELGKPMILHCVRSLGDVLAWRKRSRARQPWIVHGFQGSLESARQAVRAGLWLSFGRGIAAAADSVADQRISGGFLTDGDPRARRQDAGLSEGGIPPMQPPPGDPAVDGAFSMAREAPSHPRARPAGASRDAATPPDPPPSRVEQVFAALPLDRVFLETDEAPVAIEAVYARAAAVRGIALEELAAAMVVNFKGCFPGGKDWIWTG